MDRPDGPYPRPSTPSTGVGQEASSTTSSEPLAAWEGPGFRTESPFAFYRSLFARYARLFVGMSVLMGLYSAVTGFRLLASGALMDGVMVHYGLAPGKFVGTLESARRWLGASGKPLAEMLQENDAFLWFLVGTIAVFAGAAAVMAVAVYFKEYFAQLLVTRMVVDVRKALFAHLTRQSVSYFHRQRSGDVISRLTNDVNAVQLSFRFFFEDLIQQPLVVATGLAVAFVASPLLCLVAVPFYALVLVPVIRSGKKIVKHGRGRLEKLGLVTEAIEQLFSGIRIVKAFGMEKHERRRFHERNDEYIRSTMKMTRARLRGRAVQELFYNLGIALLVSLGVLAITFQLVDPRNFFVFLLALVQVYNPIKAASRAWNQIQESRPGVERILEVLREKPSIQDRDGSVEFPGFEREIRFDRVSFSYRDRDAAGRKGGATALKLPVLRDVSFVAKKGEMVALVGPSGAGKTTIVDLLARFYEPQEGRILIDGRDVRDFRHESYLRAIAIVSQDPFLFNATIRENIRYGRESATEAEIEEAARVAFAHEFILQQPNGYDTLIGDRGAMLSTGQRQRITIARAVLKKAQILILDEATSSLDSRAEAEVQCAIDNLIHHCTTFVVAHRLSTIVGADRILFVEDGRIVESGRHEELLARRGAYFRLWQAQHPDSGEPQARRVGHFVS